MSIPLFVLKSHQIKAAGKLDEAVGTTQGEAKRGSRRWLGRAKEWHDKRATEIFGPGKGRQVGRRAYDKSAKGRDIEFKSDNFAKRPRSEEELGRMERQIAVDRGNKQRGLADPHWHFDHDPTLAPEMEPVLRQLEEAQIPWTHGHNDPF